MSNKFYNIYLLFSLLDKELILTTFQPRMRQLDFAFEFNGDIYFWSILGSSQDLFHLFLPLDNSKKLFRFFWTCSTPVFRIEQCMDQQSNNILPWSLIKSTLGRSKKG